MWSSLIRGIAWEAFFFLGGRMEGTYGDDKDLAGICFGKCGQPHRIPAVPSCC